MSKIYIIKDKMAGIGYREILSDVLYPYSKENVPTLEIPTLQ